MGVRGGGAPGVIKGFARRPQRLLGWEARGLGWYVGVCVTVYVGVYVGVYMGVYVGVRARPRAE